MSETTESSRGLQVSAYDGASGATALLRHASFSWWEVYHNVYAPTQGRPAWQQRLTPPRGLAHILGEGCDEVRRCVIQCMNHGVSSNRIKDLLRTPLYQLAALHEIGRDVSLLTPPQQDNSKERARWGLRSVYVSSGWGLSTSETYGYAELRLAHHDGAPHIVYMHMCKDRDPALGIVDVHGTVSPLWMVERSSLEQTLALFFE